MKKKWASLPMFRMFLKWEKNNGWKELPTERLSIEKMYNIKAVPNGSNATQNDIVLVFNSIDRDTPRTVLCSCEYV